MKDLLYGGMIMACMVLGAAIGYFGSILSSAPLLPGEELAPLFNSVMGLVGGLIAGLIVTSIMDHWAHRRRR